MACPCGKCEVVMDVEEMAKALWEQNQKLLYPQGWQSWDKLLAFEKNSSLKYKALDDYRKKAQAIASNPKCFKIVRTE